MASQNISRGTGGLVRPVGEKTSIGATDRIGIIGDPGCDGLGASTMGIYARALNRRADLGIIVGDMVPHGSRAIYRSFTEFTDTLADYPVYTLKGNHDTEFYEEFFGSPNYALSTGDLLLVVLDNARRRFTDEALEFASRVLSDSQEPDIIFLFHYPPPNPIAPNSVNPPEWEEFRRVYAAVIGRIRYFIAGHVHSLGITEIDGVPVIVTGGAGARLESLDGTPGGGRQRHHIFVLYRDSGAGWKHEIEYLDESEYSEALSDDGLKERLENAFSNEVKAAFRYALMARKAEDLGRPGMAGMLRALSDSEFHHAMNHDAVLRGETTLLEDLESGVENEAFEVNRMYREYIDYADSRGQPLARYAFNDAWNAEKVHQGILSRAIEAERSGLDFPESTWYTCTSCGYTFETESAPGRCPVCGAPGDKIRQVD